MKNALLVNGAPIAPLSPGAGAGAASEPGLRFLDAADPEHFSEWLERWNVWPAREVSAHPAYVRLFARAGDRVMCAAARTPGGGILYPVIVRPLAIEPWAEAGETGCDLTNAYGYGGPYAWNVTEVEARDFWAGFDAWARSLGAVTSFDRLSPFPEQLLPCPGTTRDQGVVIARSLGPSPEEIWSDYDGKVRRNVQRARREGLEVVFDPRGDRLDDFLAVYTSTMDRRNALEQYYFPRSFFESIIADLPGQFLFAHALSQGKVVSSDLILLSTANAYYFLGGTLAEAYPLRPNDLLKHEIFLQCRLLGRKRVLLGGGYGPEDGLLRYKRAFAPSGALPFRVGFVTRDAARSDRLVEHRREWGRRQGHEWAPADGFFPVYRG